MKIQLIKVVKAQDSVAKLAQTYFKRLRGVEFTFLKNDGSLKKLLNTVGGQDRLILLDELGKEFKSLDLAKKMTGLRDDPQVKKVIIVIGGPYGFPQEVKDLFHESWCLSQLTLPTDLAWLFACEQLYRCQTIMDGTPYHH